MLQITSIKKTLKASHSGEGTGEEQMVTDSRVDLPSDKPKKAAKSKG